MVLLGAGWTGKAGQEERAGESWSEWGEGTLLGGAEFGTESHEAALTVSLHPGCSCLGVPETPLFPLSLGHDESGSHLQEPGEKSFFFTFLFFASLSYFI